MSIIIDICLIIAVLLSSVVTAPNEILYIFTNGWGTFMLSIGILWLVGVWVRISFQSHVLPSIICAMFFFGTGFISKAFGPFFAILYMIIYIARVVISLRHPKVVVEKENDIRE
jgi:hypothetical protein